MLEAFNAAPAAAAASYEADDQCSHVPQHSQHAQNHSSECQAHPTGSAAGVASETGSQHDCHAEGRAAGHSPAARAQQQQHGHDQIPHHLSTNRATLSRISSVAQEQLVGKMARARQNSIEKHVLQHDMFQGNSSQAAHTVHRADTIPESFQEPTLGSILRESAVADDTARRQAKKAAKAADDALPLFVTTSSSLQSTSRQHSRPNSRPGSAAGTMTRHQFASELGLHAESLRSAIHDSSPLSSPRQHGHMSKMQSPRGQATSIRDAYSPQSTGRAGSISNLPQVYNKCSFIRASAQPAVANITQ